MNPGTQEKKYRRRRSGEFTPEIEELFDLLKDYYTEEWLNTKGDNRIQILWGRIDELSTVELETLAASIKVMASIDEKWTRDQVQKSKSSNDNNCRGAIFELSSLAMLNDSNHPVKTVRANKEGYDGIIEQGENRNLRLSIKNYGKSERQKNFEMFSKYVDNKILQLLTKYDYPPVQIIILSVFEYPSRLDWFKLINNLDIFFERALVDQRFEYSICSTLKIKDKLYDIWHWNLLWSKIEDGINEFHPAHKSYSIMVAADYHKNEYRNIYSSIEKACHNLVKHSSEEGNEYKNSLLIHIPASIDINLCKRWVENFFKKNPDTPISLVMLYQPMVARDENNGNVTLGHVNRYILRDERFIDWPDWKFNLKFTQRCGVHADTIEPMLVTYYPNGDIGSIPIAGKYLYQHGEHYIKMKLDKDGNFTGRISNPSSGININAVLDSNQTAHMALKGIFQPNDDLLIL